MPRDFKRAKAKYVCPECRSESVGLMLLNKASKFAISKNWERLEVPPVARIRKNIKFLSKKWFFKVRW